MNWYSAWERGDRSALVDAIRSWAGAGRPTAFTVDPAPLASHADTLAQILLDARAVARKPGACRYEDDSWPLWEAVATAITCPKVTERFPGPQASLDTSLGSYAINQTLRRVMVRDLTRVVHDAAKAAAISRPDLVPPAGNASSDRPSNDEDPSTLLPLQLLVLGRTTLLPPPRASDGAAAGQPTLTGTIAQIARQIADRVVFEVQVAACACPTCQAAGSVREEHDLTRWSPDADTPTLNAWLARWLFNRGGLSRSGFARLGSRVRLSAEPGLRVLDARNLVRTDHPDLSVSTVRRPCPQDLVVRLRLASCTARDEHRPKCPAGRLAGPDYDRCSWYVSREHPDGTCVNCDQTGCTVHQVGFDGHARKVEHLAHMPDRLRLLLRVLDVAFGGQHGAPDAPELVRQQLGGAPALESTGADADMQQHTQTLLLLFNNEPVRPGDRIEAACRYFRAELFSDAVRDALAAYGTSVVARGLPVALDHARSPQHHISGTWEERADQIIERLVPADDRGRSRGQRAVQHWAEFILALQAPPLEPEGLDPVDTLLEVLWCIRAPGQRTPAAHLPMAEDFPEAWRTEALGLLALLGGTERSIIDEQAAARSGRWLRATIEHAGGLEQVRADFPTDEFLTDVLTAFDLAVTGDAGTAIETVDPRRDLDRDHLQVLLEALAAGGPKGEARS